MALQIVAIQLRAAEDNGLIHLVLINGRNQILVF